ncbi:BREX-1 system phosphatase PglZ type A [Chryseobacterium wangxinyae]|uniref:BREX-1 system phosphatase PglZ type A n=1 Tax=Chryseobacterium sp. CY353 TaxID=2997334 RepID=UPI00226DED22|nr:BREX-1 system phosphatase PglZ type A [Chryseobacterium sp. CY353]MCY0970256.1 BREX-1 system phosphatase PglZ type A [Chryseobacterium sp. CY353]
MNKIGEALIKLFGKHRLIFWYDENQELLDQYKELSLENVKKIAVQGNEFEVKHIVVKKFPTDQFLLYFNSKKPLDEENWLLDLELANYIFQTDQEAMFLQEMGLYYHLKELVGEHLEFFKAKDRRNKLKEYIDKDDDFLTIRYKMLAVVFGTENISLPTYVHTYGSSYIDESDRYEKDLARYNLRDFFWKEIERKYKYFSEAPSIYDFLLEVFSNNFSLGKNTKLSKESRLLLSLWKDTFQFREYFGKISDKISTDIDVETKLNTSIIDDVLHDDTFKLIDLKIIHELVHLISEEDISVEKVGQIVKERENKFWYQEFESFYFCLLYASQLISLIRKYGNTKYESFNEGVSNYSNVLFEIDQTYRKFVWSYRMTNQNKILSELSEKIDKVYSNDWLMVYGNNWQKVIDKTNKWEPQNSQANFYNTYIKSSFEKQRRLFIIISDAFRYECGVEFTRRLQAENRFEATISPMVSSLPSFTKLGMASLLPHYNLKIKEGSDFVLADGMSTEGVQGRTKVLQANAGSRAIAIGAEDFMSMNSAKEGRDFVKQYDLIYIYHNRIDKAGDDKVTERKGFDAVEEEISFLMKMTRKVNAMNGKNMLITSDHGFIYQHNKIAESDFSVSNHTGELWSENRRFIIGKNLINDSATKKFNGADLGLQSGVDVLIPKSINRLRVKGSGSRFVHGGSTLQEIVIPVIKVAVKDVATTSKVEIDIIKSTDKITTNILAVSFIQNDLVTQQILPRSLRAVIVAEDGEELSDQFKFIFDKAEGSERQREVKHRFQLSSKASGKYKNQRVKLVLEEPVDNTSKWKEYKEFYYTLNISFTNDFDD